MIDSINDVGLRHADLETLLESDFQLFENLMSEAVQAAYLLGYDTTRDENRAKLAPPRPRNASTPPQTRRGAKTDFADGDDPERAERLGNDKMGIDLRFDVPPKEVIDYIKRKKVLPPREFNKLAKEAKAGSFSVSQVYKNDLLEAFRGEILEALETGRSTSQTVKRFKEILNGAGHKMLGNFHLETVVRTNMQMAYGVGRRRSMEDVKDLLPFWRYEAVNDDRTRPKHRALDGVIYPADHDFWKTHYPPIDFMCRCSVVAELDMPDGYDPTQPNADTTIYLDADGVPDKAEYQTQMVDLKATTFNGVPPMASLEAALKAGAKRARTSRKK